MPSTKRRTKPETASQKTKAKKDRPGTGLDPRHGNEISRTGKITPKRNLRSSIDVLNDDDVNLEGDLSVTSQNAVGGKRH